MKFSSWKNAAAFTEEFRGKLDRGEATAYVSLESDSQEPEPIEWESHHHKPANTAWDRLVIRREGYGVCTVLVERWPDDSIRQELDPEYFVLSKIEEPAP